MKLGIIGGGQLGLMLFEASVSLGIEVFILDKDPLCSCRFLKNFRQGNILNYNDVLDFAKDLDIITIEIENINLDALSTLEQSGKLVYPTHHSQSICKSKINQKDFFTNTSVPTSPYFTTKSLSAIIKFPCVVKLDVGGYDGRGVFLVKNASELAQIPEAPRYLVEETIKIKKEVAVIACRSNNGEISIYPLVDIGVKNNMLDTLTHPSAFASREPEIHEYAKKILQALGYVGVMGIEVFIDEDDQLIFNELSPRVHNTGHYTSDACYTSQFSQHLRAILGLPLGSVLAHSSCLMMNIVGDTDDADASAFYSRMREKFSSKNSHIHLYHKQSVRVGRKMGHVNVISDLGH